MKTPPPLPHLLCFKLVTYRIIRFTSVVRLHGSRDGPSTTVRGPGGRWPPPHPSGLHSGPNSWGFDHVKRGRERVRWEVESRVPPDPEPPCRVRMKKFVKSINFHRNFGIYLFHCYDRLYLHFDNYSLCYYRTKTVNNLPSNIDRFR